MKTTMNSLIAFILVCLIATVNGWHQQMTSIEKSEINFSSPPKGNFPFQGYKRQTEVQAKADKKHGELPWHRFGQLWRPATPSASAPSQPSASASVVPITGTLACNAISGDYWIMSREIAAGNVQDFCNQHDKTKVYNGGSDNELSLSVKKAGEDNLGPRDSPDCVGRFIGFVLDGCDGRDAVNNPWNYKFGSTLTTSDGWEFAMAPLSKQVTDVNCDVSYKGSFDGFEIRGKNLPWAEFGANGEGLRDEVAGCDGLTEWKFKWTPDDCCFQWYATGHLPIGKKACVGRALESAGGSGKSHCKRNVARSDSTDRWSGYGDEE
jgi:hypothetical protein